MSPKPDVSLEELVAATMLELIIHDVTLVARYRKLFTERIDAYRANELDAYTYVVQITTLAEEKLQ